MGNNHFSTDFLDNIHVQEQQNNQVQATLHRCQKVLPLAQEHHLLLQVS